MNALTWFADWLTHWAACLILALPVVLAAAFDGRRGGQAVGWRRLIGAALFFGGCLALARSDALIHWLPAPWQGMALQAGFALAMIGLTRSAAISGLGWPAGRSAWRAAALATGAFLAFVAIRNVGLRWIRLSQRGELPGPELLLYLLTLPGIAEELAYRGVIQSRLNGAFAGSRLVFGASVGWGFILTAIIFWAMHAVRAENLSLSFYWPTLTLQLPAALLFGWLRERTGSVIPGAIAHNLVNLVWQTV